MDTTISEHSADHRPLVIGGMHRSGTSLTASLVASAGVSLGEHLLGALPGNELGHFEDIGFLDFHQLALRTLGLGTEGYTPQPVGPVPASLEQPARQLIAARRQAGRPWGWKEPRTTLFLDFWQRLLPDAGYLFVFRRPDEVLDSLLRRGDTAFAHNPRLGLLVWLNYNRTIRDFIHAHPDSCVLLEIGQVIADPPGVMERIRTKLGIDVGEPEPLFHADSFRVLDDGSRAEVARALVPEAWDVYADLCRQADVQAAAPEGPMLPVVDCAALQWGRAARAESGVADLRRELAGVRAEAATLQGRAADAEAEARLRANDASSQEAERLRLGELLVAAEAESRHLADERSRLEHARRVAVETAERLQAEHASLSAALAATGAERDRLATALRSAEETATAAAARLALLEDARRELTARITAAATEQRRIEADLSAARDHVERLEAVVQREQERRDMLAARLTETQAELAFRRERTLGARLRRWTSLIRGWFDRHGVGVRRTSRPAAHADGGAAVHKDAA